MAYGTITGAEIMVSQGLQLFKVVTGYTAPAVGHLLFPT